MTPGGINPPIELQTLNLNPKTLTAVISQATLPDGTLSAPVAGTASEEGDQGNVSEEAPSDGEDSVEGADGVTQQAEQQPEEDAAERAERLVREDEILAQAARLEKARSAKVRRRNWVPEEQRVTVGLSHSSPVRV